VFLLKLFGFRLFCVFSPLGLKSFYALPEADASFAEATRTLLGLKLPSDLLAGELRDVSRTMKPSLMQKYVQLAVAAATQEAARLALLPGETVDVFGLMRVIVHRLSFSCWACEEAGTPAAVILWLLTVHARSVAKVLWAANEGV